MSNAIQTAIEQAKAASANLVVEHQTQPQTVAAYQAPRMVTLQELMVGSFSADAWMNVNAMGICIGANRTKVFKTLDLELDLSAVKFCWRVKFGSPAEYRSTYDNVNDSRGGLWTDTLSRAKLLDPRAFEYRSADLPFTSSKDIKDDAGAVVLAAGKVLGHSLSTTGWKGWATLVNDLIALGVNPTQDKISVTVVQVYNKNQRGEWGTLEFRNPKKI